MKHTPTPWIAVGNLVLNRQEYRELIATTSRMINPDDNAAFIVEACNAHDALVARVAELEAALRDLLKAEEDYGDCNNVAVNQAWLAATRILAKVKP